MLNKKQTIITKEEDSEIEKEISNYLKFNKIGDYGLIKNKKFIIKSEPNFRFLFKPYIEGVIVKNGESTNILVEYKVDPFVKAAIVFSCILTLSIYLFVYLFQTNFFVINGKSLDFLLIVIPVFMLVLFKIVFILHCDVWQKKILNLTKGEIFKDNSFNKSKNN